MNRESGFKWVISAYQLHKRNFLRFIIGAFAFLMALNVFSNPVLDNIAAGNVSVQQNSNSTVINQSSQKAIINWQQFNVGQNETVHFQQPTGGVTLNRINPTQGVSHIYGQLTATGQVILLNPAGIYFGPSAFVNVGGLIATTGAMSDHAFMSGHYQFTHVPGYNGAIVNEGQLIAANNGLIALVAPGVINRGHIQANLGHVVLASGNAFTIDFTGDGLINFVINQATSAPAVDHQGNTLTDGVKNTGSILANGGTIIVSAKTAAGMLDHVINMEGLVQAQSVQKKNGTIIFSSDPNEGIVRVAGTVDVSGKRAGEKGGKVEVTGKYILVDSGTDIDASGDQGGGIVRLGGNYLGKGPLPNATALVTAENTRINADAITNGKGGEIILWSDAFTNVNSDLSARGGSLGGDGGFIETSSKEVLQVGDIAVDTTAAYGKVGTWLLDPRNVTINAVSTTGGSFDGGAPNIFTPNANSATILNTTLNANLASANVVITTGSTGSEDGNITVSAPINWASGYTLTLQAANNIDVNAAISGANGGLALLGANVNSNASGVITIGVTLTLNNTGTSSVLNGVIAGNGGILKTGSGTITLSGSNSYAGSTAIYGGAISVSSDTNLGTAPGAVTPASITLNGGTLITTAGFTLNANRGITLGGPGGTIQTDAGTLTYNGIIAGSGSLTKSGGGTLLIGGNSAYSGATNINAGTLSNNSATDPLPTTTAVTVASGALYETGVQTVGSIAGSGTISLYRLTVGTDNTSTIFSGEIGGTNGSLTKVGSGMLTLSGDSLYTSGTTVEGGILNLASSGSTAYASEGVIEISNGAEVRLGATSYTRQPNILISGDGTLTATVNGVVYDGSINVESDATIGALTGASLHLTSVDSYIYDSAITFNADGGNIIYDGTIMGSSSLTKIGSGALTLNGENTSSGNITISAGTLTLGAADRINDNSAVSIASGATFNLNDFDETVSSISGAGNIALGNGTLTTGDTSNTTFSGVMSGGGNLIKQGSGILTLSGINTYTGSTTINNGTLSLSGPNQNTISSSTEVDIASGATLNLDVFSRIRNLSGSGSIMINGNFSLVLENSLNTNFSGAITGVGGPDVAKNGSGSLTLSGAGSFYTSLSISGGSLILGASNIIPDNAGVFISAGATFDLNSFNETVRFIYGSGGSVSLGSGTLTIDGNTTSTFSGVISGSGNLVKQGSGTTTLSGVNTYTGKTTISGGALNILADSGLGAAPISFVADQLTLNGGTLGTSGTFTLNANRGITLGAGNGTINSSGDLTIASVIAGTGGLIKSGSGSLILNVANTFNGGVVLNDGTLTVGNNAALGAGTLTYNGGAFSISGNRSIANNITLNNPLFFLDISDDLTLSGVITGTSLYKLGSGNLTLSNANVLSGYTTLDGGTLTIANDSALGSSVLSYYSGTLAFSGDRSIANTIVLGNNLTIDNTTNVTLSGFMHDGGNNYSLTKSGSGNLTLSNSNGIGGGVILNAGTLTVADDSALGSGSLTYNSGTFAISGERFIANEIILNDNMTLGNTSDLTLSGLISGNFGIIKQGSGGLTLSGASTFSGGVTLNAGTLIVGNNSALGAGTFTYNGGTLSINSNRTLANNILLNASLTFAINNNLLLTGIIDDAGGGFGLTKSGTGDLALSGANTFSGGVTFTEGTLTINNDSALGTGTFTITGGNSKVLALVGDRDIANDITLVSNNLSIDSADNIILSGVIDDSGTSVTVTKSGGGSLTLSNANTFSGGMVLNDGTLILGNNNALGTGGLTYNGGSLATTASISIANNILLNDSLAISGSNDLTLNGIVSGASGITKSGSGVLTLAGVNTYSGDTVINDGAVIVTNSQSLGSTDGSTIVNAGSTLQINNTALGAEEITLNNGTLASTGTTSLDGAVILANGSSNTISVAGGGALTMHNNINGAGALNIDGTGVFAISGSIGNTTALTSLTSSVATTLGGSVTTTNNQNYLSTLTLADNLSLTSNAGAINIGDTLDGAFDLAIISVGATTLGGAVGDANALNSLSINAGGGINVESGSIVTVGDQTYHTNVNLLSDTVFETNGALDAMIAFENGMSGQRNVTLNSGAANQTFALNGNIDANNITVNGGSGNNTLVVNTNTHQQWDITGSNSGVLIGVSNITGNFNFNNISNLSGGANNDTFILSGGTLAGNILGGAGVNSLYGANVANTWNIIGVNAGTVIGVGGSFSEIQNLTGGDSGNTFIFADQAMITGTIDGGALSPNQDYFNTFDFSAYTTPVTVNLIGGIFGGDVQDDVNTIVTYSNVDNLIGNFALDNSIYLPEGKSVSVVMTGVKQGYIGDPTYFYGFVVKNMPIPPVPPAPPTPPAPEIAQIIQQPEQHAPVTITPSTSWSGAVDQNIHDIIDDIQKDYDIELEKIKVNPYCTAQSS